MVEQTQFETIKVESGQLVDRISRLIHEGNVRRIVIRQDENIIAEFPLTVGIVGTMIAPIAAAIGALVALLTHCSIEVEHTEPAPLVAEPPAAPSVGETMKAVGRGDGIEI
jgi:Domain of unknown function (DUF4342)